ncbi:AlpA family transcriptional regulator [Pseudomonas putida]|uniref:helix-turn-helix transcriptional regulator n=1 Tax=Pseudomonas putida TaxID=303 RepID=UPI002363948F|nr:AlpA family transcriptional regulator [Pseudomonas putida]MDD2150092.1 AlpA family transcriptional regulator [Pseudomonas putida]
MHAVEILGYGFSSPATTLVGPYSVEASAIAEIPGDQSNPLLEVTQMKGATLFPAGETKHLADDIEFIRLREVKRITGMGRSYIYEKMKTGDFPGQIKLGPRTVAWINAEVLAWVREKVVSTRAAEVEHAGELRHPE